jgi:hypothetical protein
MATCDGFLFFVGVNKREEKTQLSPTIQTKGFTELLVQQLL